MTRQTVFPDSGSGNDHSAPRRRKEKGIPNGGGAENDGCDKDMEEKIIAMLETDPQEAMVLLVEEYTGLLWNVAGQHLTNPEDIRECVNDTFAEFYFHQDRFDRTKGSLSTFLAAIVRNRAVSLYRKNRAHEAAPLPEDAAGTTEDMDLSEVRLDVEKAMKQLKPEDVEIIRMKYYEGKSVREIAESLGLPYETVKKRHQRGLSKLKLLLLGVLIAAILALLAACAYVVLRHFGVIPGYQIDRDEATQLYIWDRTDTPPSVESELGTLTLVDAVCRNGELRLYVGTWVDSEEAQQEFFNWGLYENDPTLDETILTYSGPSGERSFPRNSFGVGTLEADGDRYLCDLHFTFVIDEDLEFPADVVLHAGDLSFPFRMIEPLREPADKFPHAEGSRGSLLAIPQWKDGQLAVEIYPLETSRQVISSHIIYDSRMQGRVGDITATCPDGSTITGNITPAPVGSGFYSTWVFDTDQSGDYVLHVPYLCLDLPEDDSLSIPLDLENCAWEEGTGYAIPGGTIYIEDCRQITPTKEDLALMIAPDNACYWKLQVRCEMDRDLELTSLPLAYVQPEFETPEHKAELAKALGGTWVPGILTKHILLEDPAQTEILIQVDMDRGYDLTDIHLTNGGGPVGVRWMHSFDIPFTVEEK